MRGNSKVNVSNVLFRESGERVDRIFFLQLWFKTVSKLGYKDNYAK